MKMILTAAVMLGMAGGAHSAEFGDLQRLTASELQAVTADDTVVVPFKAGGKVKIGFVTEGERNAYIAKAKLWLPEESLNTAAMDFRRGPYVPMKYVIEETVDCNYIPMAIAYDGQRPNGKTPKFKCENPAGKSMKIKYGAQNGELQCEVAATWLMTAIGAYADKMYPIKLNCPDCPSDPFVNETDIGAWTNGAKVVTEDKLGARIEIADNSGIGFNEFHLIEDRVGAEALAGLTQFLGNTDNKAPNQAIGCAKKDIVADAAGKGVCLNPVVYMQDAGITFGGDALYHNKRMNFVSWSKERIWQDPAKCIMHLNEVGTGSLAGVDSTGRDLHQIGEKARQMLVRRLSMLSRSQLADIFTAARAPDRAPKHSADEWAGLFMRKVEELRYPMGPDAKDFACPYEVVPPNSAAPVTPVTR